MDESKERPQIQKMEQDFYGRLMHLLEVIRTCQTKAPPTEGVEKALKGFQKEIEE